MPKIEYTIPDPLIAQLDVEYVVARLSSSKDPLTGQLGWHREAAEAVSVQYKAFLYLCKKYPDETIVPFRELDEFWHNHILFTKKYSEDCERIFGYYLHHFSHKQESEDDHSFYKNHYSKTIELLLKEFPDLQ